MAISVLIGLEPPKKVVENINKIRKKTSKIENFYFASRPHITLFGNTYSNLKKVEEIIKKIAKSTSSPIQTKVKGIHSFGHDAITNLHTLVYLINSTPEIIKLRKKIVNSLNPLRTKHTETKYSLKKFNFSKKQKISLKKFGYPYSPFVSPLHSTIGSFPEATFNKIQKITKKDYNFSGNFDIKFINIYIKKIKEKTPHKFYKKIPLN